MGRRIRFPGGRMTRRNFLGYAGAASAVGLASIPRGPLELSTSPATAVRRVVRSRRDTQKLLRWSDPATWDGPPPRSGDEVIVRGRVLFDLDRRVGGLSVERRAELAFDPSKTATLSSDGNVVIDGTLTMRPANASVTHTLRFPSVDERAFVGGGMDVLASDVGLWVMGAGTLDLAGTPRTPWVRAAGSVNAERTVLSLASAPVGWRLGDTVAITPTLPPTVYGHSVVYDVSTVTKIEGATVTLAAPTKYDHPAVGVATGKPMTAEVLNLTRNVRIEGSERGRSHVFIQSTVPQHVSNTAIRYVGPRRGRGESSTFVLGRYGIHFHMVGDGSRGSLVENVVVRNGGNHAFVPHMSHGITMRGCISHDTVEESFWYDGKVGETPGDPTNDLSLVACVASLVKTYPRFRGFRLSGFSLDRGTGNTITGCVAVGVQGNKEASGFGWPQEGKEYQGQWLFEDNVAHNNAVSGIFVWENTHEPHEVRRFTAYHNGVAGIDHGSYKSSWTYEDSTLVGNAEAGIILHAEARATPELAFRRLLVDGSGFSPYGIMVVRHSTPGGTFTQIEQCTFRNNTAAAIGWVPNGRTNPDLFDVVDCTFDGNEFWLSSSVDPASVINVQDATHGSITLRRRDQPGSFVKRWNASVSH